MSEMKNSIKRGFNKPIPFGLKEIFGVFATFFTGIAIILLAFLSEFVLAKLQRRLESRNAQISRETDDSDEPIPNDSDPVEL